MDNIDKITEDYEKEHQEREKRMDKKFKEAMDSIEKGNRTLDKIDQKIDKIDIDKLDSNLGSSLNRLDKSVDSYCKTIKICVTTVMITAIIAAIIICGFAIFI